MRNRRCAIDSRVDTWLAIHLGGCQSEMMAPRMFLMCELLLLFCVRANGVVTLRWERLTEILSARGWAVLKGREREGKGVGFHIYIKYL